MEFDARERRAEIYRHRDTGYDTEVSFGLPRNRGSPEELVQKSAQEVQEEIDTLEREIERLTSARKRSDSRSFISEQLRMQDGLKTTPIGPFDHTKRLVVEAGDRRGEERQVFWQPEMRLGSGEPARTLGLGRGVGRLASKSESRGNQADRAETSREKHSKFVAEKSFENKGKSVPPTIKLGVYDGSTPLETHLAKFENCSSYYGWNEKERLCHLRASLDGHAGQILWEAGPSSTESEIVKLLRNRFGNLNQMERYRAELRTRRRRPGESIQSVYQDIRRLLALGFPNQAGELYETIGRDAFLEALGDSSLRIRVLDQQPTTLDDVLSIVSRMEAYSGGTVNIQDDLGENKRKIRAVNVEATKDSECNKSQTDRLEKLIQEQNSEIKRLRKDLDEKIKISSTVTSLPVPQVPQAPRVPTSNSQPTSEPNRWTGNGNIPMEMHRTQPNYGGQGPGQPPFDTRIPNDMCRRCHRRGHWARECPNNRFQSGPLNGSSLVGGVASSVCGSETYLSVQITSGKTLNCLIDSGSDRSIIPHRITRNIDLQPTNQELFAANGTVIKVLGKVRIYFRVANLTLFADVLVSDDIEEFILGYDWLRDNHCEWVFDSAVLIIHGTPVKLYNRPSGASVRRIYVRESVCVPVDSQINVPIRLPYANLHVDKCDWIMEPRELKPGIFVARALLSDNDEFAAASFVNVSNDVFYLRSGQYLGDATPFVGQIRSWEDEVTSEGAGVLEAQTVATAWPSAVADAGSGLSPHPTGDHSQPRSGEEVEPKQVTMVTRLRGDGLELNSASQVNSFDTVDRVCSINTDDQSQNSCESVARDFDFSDNGEFAHLKPIVDSLPSELSETERDFAVKLIVRNADVFSKSEFDVGRTDLITHTIDTGDHRPIAEPLRSHPRVHLDLIDDTIDKLLDAGIIEEASSPWSANIVVVAKPDNPVPRITLDYRKLNAITYKDKFPLPKTSDCVRAMEGSMYFSIVDLSSSFFQVPLDPKDRDKTAFVTRKSQYRFTVMPQGAVNSPSVFCRLMSMVLKGLNWVTCCAYIDDTVVMGRTFSEAAKNLEEVLQRFRQAKLKLKPKKCKFFQLKIKFCGFLVSSQAIEVNPERVNCVVAWKFPRTLTELRGFLGLCSYYRSFCPGFANVAEPLTECLRKGVPLCWTERRQLAFDQLKNFLVTAPVLGMPSDDVNCTYVLDCDASQIGAGAVLQQWQDGKLKVIEYASRVFSAPERSYCVTRREMAALIFGLKHFRQYLLGRHFVIRVDHMALTFYQRTPEPVGQQARYLDFISQFDFEIKYRDGKRHINADSLSRLRPCEMESGGPCKQCHKRVTGEHVDPEISHVNTVETRAQKRRRENDDENLENSRTTFDVGQGAQPLDGRPGTYRRVKQNDSLLKRTAPNALVDGVQGWTVEFLAEQQLKDPDIGPAVKWITVDGTRPPWKEVKSLSPALRSLWQQFDSLIVKDGVLYRNFYNVKGFVDCLQFVLPSELKVSFLELIHGDVAGHLKFVKCLDHVKRRAWWYTWKRDLKLFIDCCKKCASYHRGAAPKQGLLNPMVVGGPGERWCIDLTGPHCLSDGYKYLFTAICPFSKYAVAVPIRNKEASTVANVIVNHIFLKWGLCFEILHDLGKEFEAALLSELLKILGILNLKSSGYRPQTSGSIEVWHKVLNSMLAKVINENQRDWCKWINYVVFCYNATSHSSTGFSPHFVMTGRQPLWNVDFLLGNVDVSELSVPEYTTLVLQQLDKAFHLVREHLNATADYARTWYNRRVKPHDFEIGDPVRVYNPRRFRNRSPKWQSFYAETGVVVKKLNDATYIVKLNKSGHEKIFHVDKLKLIKHFSN